MNSLAKILIVDDNPKYLEDVLPMYGYDVEVATDGIKALQLIQQAKPQYNLVLLDVMMPNLDGWETLKRIRSNPKTENLPVIMLTAVDEEQKQVLGLRTGADDYITKPFVLPNLLARIESLLRRSQWKDAEAKAKAKINIDFEYDESTISPLTAKEKEILSLVAKGATNDDISKKLNLQESTIKTHLNRVFKKLNVKTRTQAVLLALQMNFIDD